ncbi:HNH endonuclease [Jannaschia sp. Os4]|uniref:HNH endonuclease n=1 Tax=Jannaschia sp. Os4 TaxID=2807617 RepID=UPI00193A5DC2|nr:HNH endonuclease [Jannaschia sp. Os4]MBM2575194.1 HNH endonuclease [Jannaschia sp. Os4]
MPHAVLIQNPTSIYNDAHGAHYHFPKQYLGTLSDCIGDWVVFYEGRRGAFGYTHVAKIAAIRPDPVRPDHFYADLVPGETLDFETLVPRARPDGTLYESTLAPRAGNNMLAVRRLPPADFAAIVDAGLAEVPDADAHPRTGPLRAFGDRQSPFPGADRRTALSSRSARDAAFGRMVRRAYGRRCAISGLGLRNGGGRAEVQAAHIVPVAEGGADVVRNGIALSGTLHWMFDRGLIGVEPATHRILVSHNKVDADTARRLFVPDMVLRAPDRLRDRPSDTALAWHREHVFGR